MTTTSQIAVETKAAVSCSEMARMCGLSRQRFSQLQGTTFPWPLYDVATRRPFYPEDLQKVCLEVRRRNWGIDNRPVLFYAARLSTTPTTTAKPTKKISKEIKALVEDVKDLGLKTATTAQVESMSKKLYSDGTNGIDPLVVAKEVFLAIRRQHSAEKVGSKE